MKDEIFLYAQIGCNHDLDVLIYRSNLILLNNDS